MTTIRILTVTVALAALSLSACTTSSSPTPAETPGGTSTTARVHSPESQGVKADTNR